MNFPTVRRFYEQYLARETVDQNKDQIVTVLNHLGRAILDKPEGLDAGAVSTLRVATSREANGRREPPILQANALLLGATDKLRPYLAKGHFGKSALNGYPSLLRRMLKLSGYHEVFRLPQREIRQRTFSPEWHEMIDKLDQAGQVSRPQSGPASELKMNPTSTARTTLRLLAEWATQTNLPPDPAIVHAKSDDFFRWMASQPKRFRYPVYTYSNVKFWLRKAAETGAVPKFTLALRVPRGIGVSFRDWPTAIAKAWPSLVEKWTDPNSRRGRHCGPLRPDTISTIQENLCRFLGFLRDNANKCSTAFTKLTLERIMTPELVVAYGNALTRRFAVRDAERFPNLLPAEVAKPTSSVSQWFGLAQTIMKNDLRLPSSELAPVQDALFVSKKQCRPVRDKTSLLASARDLERIPQHIRARRIEHETELIRECGRAGLSTGVRSTSMTPELSEEIYRSNNQGLIKRWRWCAALVSKEVMFLLRRYRPLRNRAYIEMRRHVNMLRDPQHGWVMRYTRAQLKALRSGLQEWKMKVPKLCVSLLEFWLTTYHPWFWNRRDKRNESYVFLTKHGDRYASGTSAMANVFKSWSQWVLGKRIYPHLWRDIVGYELMQLHNGNYILIADMLGDHPDTVVERYMAWRPLESGETCDSVWDAEAAGANVFSTRDLIRKLTVCLHTTQELSPQRKLQLNKALHTELDALKQALAELECGSPVKTGHAHGSPEGVHQRVT